MAGLGHHNQTTSQPDDPLTSARNARYGMILFIIYLAIYVGFVGLNAFYPRQMEQTPIWGVNLAILYGCGLIVAAMLLSLYYCYLCRSRSRDSQSKTSSDPR